MNELALAGITRRRRRTLTSPARVAAEPVTDLIGRDFTATRPGQRLVGDITCLVTVMARTGPDELSTIIVPSGIPERLSMNV